MPENCDNPPALAEKLLKCFLNKYEYYEKLGDLQEVYYTLLEKEGGAKAKIWYWRQVFKALPEFIYNSFQWSLIMFINYIRITLRLLKKQKIYTFIKISGLALGMAFFLLMIGYVQFEMSFDNFHEKGDRIYRVLREGKTEDYTDTRGNIGAPLAPLLLDQFPGVENAVRFTNFFEGFLKYGSKNFKTEQFFFTDGSIFDVFNFPLRTGDPETALTDPFSIILSPEMAERYFRDEDPIGKVISYKLSFREEWFDFRVTGILEEIPKNSHIGINFLASYSSMSSIVSPNFMTSHWDSPTWTYLLLRDGFQAEQLDEAFPDFVKNNVDTGSFSSYRMFVQPLNDIYFNSIGMGAPIGKMGLKMIDYILSFVAFFILLIACINFMNLSTARSACRMKEIGMRKVMGAYKRHLVMQFIGESVIYSFISLGAALVLVYLFLPKFNQLIIFHEAIGQTLDMKYLLNSNYLGFIILTTLLVGIFSGCYPAFFLSAFKPVTTLKGKLGMISSPERLRKVLVTLQFTVSIVLIVGSMLIYRQVSHWKTGDMGFSHEYVLTIPVLDKTINPRFENLKTEFLQNSNILSVTASSTEPGVTSHNGILLKGRDVVDANMGILYVDPDYIKTLDIEILDGRDFSNLIQGDAENALIMNEAALRKIGWQSGVGEDVELYWKRGNTNETIYTTNVIGIVKDFSFRGLTGEVRNVLIKIDPRRFNYILVKVNGVNISAAVEHMETAWNNFNIAQPFEYTFLDEDIANSYMMFDNFASMTRYATFFAIFIACLGLFGLASFVVERKTKDIGVRKVLGASITGIVMLLSKDFMKLVLIANVVAWPLSYFMMNGLLEGYANRISVGYSVFIISGVLAVMLAFLTVGFQAIRAAVKNPADAIQYE
ncbi:MAG: FtsX-like permease family protein [bacterium]|nr:FtsX-like permease family protein [bacterium]